MSLRFATLILLIMSLWGQAWGSEKPSVVNELDTLRGCSEILEKNLFEKKFSFLSNKFLEIQKFNKGKYFASDRPQFVFQNLSQNVRPQQKSFSHLADQYRRGEIGSILDLMTAIQGMALQALRLGQGGFHYEENPYFAYTTQTTIGVTRHFLGLLGHNVDSVWDLQLPHDELTVWGVLDEPGRRTLLEALEYEFQKGRYDKKISGVCSLNDSPAYHALGRRTRIGFSPLKFLAASIMGKVNGVCRHTNLAFVGLLMELGWPTENLRILTGCAEVGCHLFLEVRTSAQAEWYEYDATGQTRKSMDLPSRDFFAYWSKFRFELRKMQKEYDSLRKRYAQNQNEHPEFYWPQ